MPLPCRIVQGGPAALCTRHTAERRGHSRGRRVSSIGQRAVGTRRWEGASHGRGVTDGVRSGCGPPGGGLGAARRVAPTAASRLRTGPGACPPGGESIQEVSAPAQNNKQSHWRAPTAGWGERKGSQPARAQESWSQHKPGQMSTLRPPIAHCCNKGCTPPTHSSLQLSRRGSNYGAVAGAGARLHHDNHPSGLLPVGAQVSARVENPVSGCLGGQSVEGCPNAFAFPGNSSAAFTGDTLCVISDARGQQDGQFPGQPLTHVRRGPIAPDAVARFCSAEAAPLQRHSTCWDSCVCRLQHGFVPPA